MRPASKATFLDKDGTLVQQYACARRMRILPAVIEGLRLLDSSGYALVVIMNQPGMAQGYLTEDSLKYMEMILRTRLAEDDIPLRGLYYCPHDPRGIVPQYSVSCTCRKPKPGMLLRAAHELDIDLGQSWTVGANLDDVEAGRWAGCRTVLLHDGHETDWRLTEMRWPDYVADNILQAAQLITLAGPVPSCVPDYLGSAEQ